MKKQILASLLLSLVTFTGLSAQTLLSIDENWANVDDRSQTAPSLSIDNDKLLISDALAVGGLVDLATTSQLPLLQLADEECGTHCSGTACLNH